MSMLLRCVPMALLASLAMPMGASADVIAYRFVVQFTSVASFDVNHEPIDPADGPALLARGNDIVGDQLTFDWTITGNVWEFPNPDGITFAEMDSRLDRVSDPLVPYALTNLSGHLSVDQTPGGDTVNMYQYWWSGGLPAAPVGTPVDVILQVSLVDPSGHMLPPGDGLPRSADLTHAVVSAFSAYVIFGNEGDPAATYTFITGRVISMDRADVPAPSTLSLLAIGVVAGLARRRHRPRPTATEPRHR